MFTPKRASFLKAWASLAASLATNLADTLIKLERYDEARHELLRAIECKKPYGYAANPWTTWDIRHDLEQATGHPPAAAEARQQAIEAYLAYRRDGGQSYDIGAQMCAAVAQAIQTGEPSATTALAQELAFALKTSCREKITTNLKPSKSPPDGTRI